ncbi:MAG: YfhO family protein [Lachnospiraceae bacterium]|nr:YfhO family protein [Lachnospiraceae bacterium]
MRTKKQILCESLLFGLVTFFVVTVIYRINGMEPFGSGACVTDDMDIQYLDFFSYMLNVIHGNDSVIYTTHNGLGGSGYAVFSYYLASPFNILLLFFNKYQLPVFINLVIALKLAMSSVTFSVFSFCRLPKVKTGFVFILSLCYGLMQYNIGQSFNIMWLDGVYMLPLVMLALYKLVDKGSLWGFSLTIGLTIIFNWYIGGIICIFSACWFVLEYALKLLDKGEKLKMGTFFWDGIRYGVSLVLGVMLSAFLFLPSVFELQKGRGQSFDWKCFRNEFMWSPLDLMESTLLTSHSWQFGASLFCGSIVVVLMIFYFFGVKNKWAEKAVLFVVLAVAELSLCYRPLFFIFSLFKDATSYYYRYSFLVIFCMIFIALKGAEKINEKPSGYLFFAGLVLCLGLEIVTWKRNETVEARWLILTVASEVVTALLIQAFHGQKQVLCKAATVMLSCLVILELGVNTKVLFDDYYSGWDSNHYATYVKNQQEQLNGLEIEDNGRIHQTSNRRWEPFGTGLSANWNEGLGYGYNSISSYTSNPDEQAKKLLNNLGYRSEADRITITTCPILASDSILGVQYLLSEREIPGYVKIGQDKINGKYVYENPYALPMAFLTDKVVEEISEDNSFLWTNEFFQSLLGKEGDVYHPLEYTLQKISDYEWEYTLPHAEQNHMLYGNLCWSKEMYTYDNQGGGILNVNNAYEVTYAQWLSQSVFDIPDAVGEDDINVVVNSKEKIAFDEEQFYALDLEALQKATSQIQKEKVPLQINGDKITASLDVDEDTNLVLLLPYDKSWKLTINSQAVSFERCYNDYISIPLQKGENEVVFHYELKGLKSGIAVSVVACFLLLGFYYKDKKKKL